VEAYLLAGNTEQGAASLAQAVTLATEIDDGKLSNSICRSGSIDGFAEIVLPACEHAVRLAGDEDLASFRESRGLARALTGDYAGAIEDLRFYVQWAQDNDVSEEEVAQRQAWLAELEARRNPFDEQTLESLRKD
jgi:hypothetical protein